DPAKACRLITQTRNALYREYRHPLERVYMCAGENKSMDHVTMYAIVPEEFSNKLDGWMDKYKTHSVGSVELQSKLSRVARSDNFFPFGLIPQWRREKMQVNYI
ncbi:hypothetical protein PENTCL1PPCAC_4029, partial [Pristionchus entomophagus]